MSTTYSRQDELPRLPIPKLDDTCDRFLEYAKPLVSDTEFDEATRLVEELRHGEGPALQAALEEYDRADGRHSYIEDFWTAAYLDPVDPVVLNVNPFFVLEDDPTPSRNNQIARATSLILSSLKFVVAVRSETLSIDEWRGKALCMSQFRRLFGTARLPHPEMDELRHDPASSHVAVISRGQFYTFTVLAEDGLLAVGEREITDNLRCIVEDAAAESAQAVATTAIGVCTTESRKTWASLRGRLQVRPLLATELTTSAFSFFYLLATCSSTCVPPAPPPHTHLRSTACAAGGQRRQR